MKLVVPLRLEESPSSIDSLSQATLIFGYCIQLNQYWIHLAVASKFCHVLIQMTHIILMLAIEVGVHLLCHVGGAQLCCGGPHIGATKKFSDNAFSFLMVEFTRHPTQPCK